jgi:hypothetical protein
LPFNDLILTKLVARDLDGFELGQATAHCMSWAKSSRNVIQVSDQFSAY